MSAIKGKLLSIKVEGVNHLNRKLINIGMSDYAKESIKNKASTLVASSPKLLKQLR